MGFFEEEEEEGVLLCVFFCAAEAAAAAAAAAVAAAEKTFGIEKVPPSVSPSSSLTSQGGEKCVMGPREAWKGG